jgi:hypothetical protein
MCDSNTNYTPNFAPKLEEEYVHVLEKLEDISITHTEKCFCGKPFDECYMIKCFYCGYYLGYCICDKPR